MAGNPQKIQRSEEESRLRSRISRKYSEGERKNPNGNIFCGFSTNILAQSFNVDTELARKLQSQDDQRQMIVRVRGEELQLLSPSSAWEEHRQGGSGEYYNGLEETFCNMKLMHNIDRPSQADIFNPRGGRISTVNSLNLPILRNLHLTAERGVLYTV